MNEQMTYDEYERDWKRRHKSQIPRKRRVIHLQEYFWIVFWIVVASGAAIFSAAHTIPAAEMTILKDVPSRSQLAITVFAIVELVIFGAAAGRKEIEWLKYLLIASVLVALAGNVGSSVRAVSENGGDWLNQFGGILLSIIAPVTALAAGEVLHIQLDKRAAKIRIADDEYDQKQKELEAKVNQAYTKHMKQFEAVKTVNFTPLSTSKQPSKAVLDTADFLRNHVEFDNLSSREVAPLAGVSHTIVSQARQYNKQSQNGHIQ